MELKELKEQILNNTLSDDLIIFKCKENTFIADQYIDEICVKKGCTVNRITSIFEPTNSALSLVFDYSYNLNVLKVERLTDETNLNYKKYKNIALFQEVAEDYSIFKNMIVICEEIDPKLEKLLSDYVVEIPKLLDWQVLDYMKVVCSDLDESDYTWLYNNTKADIYRISNELDKLTLFDSSDRHKIFSELRFSKNNDLYVFDILQLKEAVMKNDKITILEYLNHSDQFDIDPVALTNLLLIDYKKLLFSAFNTYKKPEDLGLSSKQCWFLVNKSGYKIPTENNIRQIIKFLSSIDLKLKENKFEASKQKCVEFVLNRILALNK